MIAPGCGAPRPRGRWGGPLGDDDRVGAGDEESAPRSPASPLRQRFYRPESTPTELICVVPGSELTCRPVYEARDETLPKWRLETRPREPARCGASNTGRRRRRIVIAWAELPPVNIPAGPQEPRRWRVPGGSALVTPISPRALPARTRFRSTLARRSGREHAARATWFTTGCIRRPG